MNYKDTLKKLEDFLSNKYYIEGIGTSRLFEWVDKIVQVIHHDGTVLSFCDAAVVEMDEEWWAVVTEHYGCHLFSKGDVYNIRMYKEQLPFRFEEMKGK